MLQTISITKTEYYNQYTDLSNKVRNVRHSIILSPEEKSDKEKQIVEELYKIFTH